MLSHLPGLETGCAEQMSTGLDLDVLIVFGADFAELECTAHFTVQLVLLLGHLADRSAALNRKRPTQDTVVTGRRTTVKSTESTVQQCVVSSLGEISGMMTAIDRQL